MFCAICTSDSPGALSPGALREMDGRMVFVCDACENEHPRAGRYNFGDRESVGSEGTGRSGQNGGSSRQYGAPMVKHAFARKR